MTLQQLRFLAAIVESDFNITAAAAKLNATQPAVSRQLQLLEQELGFKIFSRSGRGLSRMTAAGELVIEHARRALRETQNIRNVSAEVSDPRRGELQLCSTHTEARYVLPNVISRFRALFPGVRLTLRQVTPEQIAELVRTRQVDIAVTTGNRGLLEPLMLMPWYRASRRVVVPKSHPLASIGRPTLAEIGKYPIAAHVFTTAESSLPMTFGKAGIDSHFALTTRDAEIIKTYVRLGMGVGIIADVAYDPTRDEDLVSIDASYLFPDEIAWAGVSRERTLRQYTYDFLSLLAPHFTRESLDGLREPGSQADAAPDFAGLTAWSAG